MKSPLFESKTRVRIEIDPGQKRRTWMLEFCDTVLTFYPKEIAKITRRIGKFEEQPAASKHQNARGERFAMQGTLSGDINPRSRVSSWHRRCWV